MAATEPRRTPSCSSTPCTPTARSSNSSTATTFRSDDAPAPSADASHDRHRSARTSPTSSTPRSACSHPDLTRHRPQRLQRSRPAPPAWHSQPLSQPIPVVRAHPHATAHQQTAAGGDDDDDLVSVSATANHRPTRKSTSSRPRLVDRGIGPVGEPAEEGWIGGQWTDPHRCGEAGDQPEAVAAPAGRAQPAEVQAPVAHRMSTWRQHAGGRRGQVRCSAHEELREAGRGNGFRGRHDPEKRVQPPPQRGHHFDRRVFRVVARHRPETLCRRGDLNSGYRAHVGSRPECVRPAQSCFLSDCRPSRVVSCRSVSTRSRTDC